MADKPHILLVEDHKDSATALTLLLRGGGFSVSHAGTVESAKREFATQPCDVMLCDVGLPDGDGCELLREMIAVRPVCAIAITGFEMEEDIERCKAAGFAAHMTKPITWDHLQKMLDKVMSKELCAFRKS
jgi:CheY-like chemotaxis protein